MKLLSLKLTRIVLGALMIIFCSLNSNAQPPELVIGGGQFGQNIVGQAIVGDGFSDPSHFRVYTECEQGQSTMYSLNIDATQLCDEYVMFMTINSSCPGINDQLSEFGLDDPFSGNGWYSATTSVNPGDSYCIPINLPCECTFTVIISLQQKDNTVIPDCPNGGGFASAELVPFN